MPLPRAVLDSTVYVSAVAKGGSGALNTLEAWNAAKFQLLLSEPIIEETARVLTQQDAPTVSIDKLTASLRQSAEWVVGAESITACRDPDDNKVLEAAVAGNADYIVTDDKDLRTLTPFRGIEIVTVRRFQRKLGIKK